MIRLSYLLATSIVVIVIWLIVTVRSAADVPTSPPVPDPTQGALPGVLATNVEQQAQVVELRRKLKHERRHVRALKRRQRQLARVLMHSTSVHEAVGLACTVYGSCTTLRRRAYCESTNDPGASNPSGASGLFQFLLSTWRSTPFAGFNVWSPYANALAAGWMQSHGRGGEWTCQ